MAAFEFPIPSAGVLGALVFAEATLLPDVLVDATINDPASALGFMADPELVACLRRALRRHVLGADIGELEDLWILAGVALLLHRTLDAAPTLPLDIGSLHAQDVLRAAIEIARLVPGFAQAEPVLARLAAREGSDS